MDTRRLLDRQHEFSWHPAFGFGEPIRDHLLSRADAVGQGLLPPGNIACTA
jgi:hypothetical protein